MQNFFFDNERIDDDGDLSSKPLKDWDDKHLPFVGWTYMRFEPKDKPNPTSVFQPSNETEESEESETEKKKKSSESGSKSGFLKKLVEKKEKPKKH